ncbi:MAG TPA: hypothetical protein VE178_18835, partial [Silvibacterium sp.]|nr:hypothetical protein [Silvibacterium sp.]
ASPREGCGPAMIGYLRRLIIRNLCSPYGIAMASYFLFLLAWVFPPGIYTHYIHELDLMYLNPMVLLYYTACVAAFLFGVRGIDFFVRAAAHSTPKIQLRYTSPLMYLALPLALAGALCFVYMLLIGSGLNFIALIATRQGDVMKQANTGGSSSAMWGSTLFLLTGVLWWAGFRASQLHLRGIARKAFYFIFAACLGVDVFTCLATFDRTNLMPLLAGCTIIYLFLKSRSGDLKLTRLAVTGFGFVFAIFASFIGLQFARGASRLDALLSSMLGYTVVSYNRMAAMIAGAMHYAYEGKGAYVVAFLLQNDRLSGVRDQMGLPAAYGLWLSEFPSLSAAGLNANYNWSSVFGYLFSDLGWWTPVYMFAAGLLAGYLWSRFRSGTTIGIVLYPWIAFWILFWFGWNLLFEARSVVLIETSVLLVTYDKLFLRWMRGSPSANVLPRSSWEPARPVAIPHRGGLF